MFDLEMASGFFGARKVVLFHLIVEKEKMGLKEKKRMREEEEMGNGFLWLPNGYLGIYTMGNEYSEINRNIGMQR